MKTFAGEGGYFFAVAKSLKKSLLKTEGLASLYRLEGALDAAGRLLESRWNHGE